MAEPISAVGLKRGISVEMRIIAALILREMRTRFGERQFGYAWALVEPLVLIGLMSGVFYVTGARPSLGGSFETFFLTGYISYGFFRDTSTQAAQAITANRALLSFPLVRNMDTIWARLALEVLTNTVALCFIVVIFVLFEIPVTPDDPLRAGMGLLSIIVFGSGCGIFNAVLSTFVKTWMTFWGWFMRLQYIASGVLFLPDRLPPFVLDYLQWNPSMHSVIIVREGFYSGYKSTVLIEYLPWFGGACLALLGIVIEKLYRRRVSQR